MRAAKEIGSTWGSRPALERWAFNRTNGTRANRQTER
jgi:hypothetical protein